MKPLDFISAGCKVMLTQPVRVPEENRFFPACSVGLVSSVTAVRCYVEIDGETLCLTRSQVKKSPW